MTKSALVAILGCITVSVAIALNFFFDGVEEKLITTESPSTEIKINPIINSKTEKGLTLNPDTPPKKGLTLNPDAPPKKGLTLNPDTPPKKSASKPSFDVVRVNPDGDTVIAGRAAPGAEVEIFDGTKQIGEVLADKRGEWVFLPSSPLPPGNRSLSLKMTNEDGEKFNSEKALVLLVPEKGKDIAGRPTEALTQPLALKVPLGDKGSIEVLQKTTPVITKTKVAEFAVDAIDYNELGELSIIGKAPKQAKVQLYLNNKYLGRTFTNNQGNWRLSPDGSVEPGIYNLRADYIEADGRVLARREVVFARSVPLTGVQPGTLVVVEPGNSLWRIARRTYGSGFRYTVIYEANKEQIKNADLIYPGQVFALPVNN